MAKIPIALIKADWHSDIVDQCVESFTAELPDKYVVEPFIVPGSLEIPLLAKKVAKSGQFTAVAAIGFVVDGGVYRHEFVAQAVISGLMQVQLEAEVPVFSAVLTPKQTFAEDGSNPEQHQFFFKHMLVKGKELAKAMTATLAVHEKI